LYTYAAIAFDQPSFDFSDLSVCQQRTAMIFSAVRNSHSPPLRVHVTDVVEICAAEEVTHTSPNIAPMEHEVVTRVFDGEGVGHSVGANKFAPSTEIYIDLAIPFAIDGGHPQMTVVVVPALDMGPEKRNRLCVDGFTSKCRTHYWSFRSSMTVMILARFLRRRMARCGDVNPP
jgi:hypothetical protein